MRPVVAVTLLTVWMGSARAQRGEPPPDDPYAPAGAPLPDVPPDTSSPPSVSPPPPAEPVAPDGYPLRLSARPLVLPVGSVEGGVDLRWTHYQSYSSLVVAEPRVRYSAPGVELEARVGIGLSRTSVSRSMTENERLASLAAMARAGLSADTAIGAELIVRTPIGDYTTVYARAFAVTKRHLTSRTAVELEGWLAATRSIATISPTPEYAVTASGGGEARGMVQVSDGVAVLGRVALFLKQYPNGADSQFVSTAGARAVVSTSPHVDFVFGLDLLAFDDPTTEITVGFVARKLP